MNKSKYFYRTVVFAKQDEKVTLVDVHNPSVKPPLEPWLGVVVSLADGQHTIQELIEYLGRLYKDEPPNELTRTIESVIGRLVEAQVIQLADEPFTLPYYLAIPADEQDAEKAKQLMLDDGYIQQIET